MVKNKTAKAVASKKMPAGSKRQDLILTPTALEIAERLGKDIPGSVNMGTASITKGVNAMAQILAQLEAIAAAWDVPLEQVLDLIPHLVRAGIRDWSALPLEGQIIAYLSQRAAEGDERAEELLEMAQIHSAELIGSRESAGVKVGDSWIA